MAVPKTKTQEEEEEDLTDDNVLNFPRLAIDNTDGNDPIDPKGQDWLERLRIGDVFYVAQKRAQAPSDAYMVALFCKINATEKTVVLRTPSSPQDIAVMPRRFCNFYELHELVGHVTNVEGAGEENNDPGEGPGIVPEVSEDIQG